MNSGMVDKTRAINRISSMVLHCICLQKIRKCFPLKLCLSLCCIALIALTSAMNNPPTNIEQLFEDFFREFIELSPETATQLGLTEEQGFVLHNNELDDVSDKALTKLYDMYRKYYDWLRQYDASNLTSSQRLLCDVLKWFLKCNLAEEKFRYHVAIINPGYGFHNQLTTLMTGFHKIQNLKDAQDYISRLKKYPDKINQLIEQINIREKKGIIPAAYMIEACQRQLDDFVRIPYADNLLFTSFKQKVQNLANLADKSKEELYEKALQALENCVYPSYTKMSKRMSELTSKANNYAGVWKYPDGDEYYKLCLYNHTTTKLTPDEIHNLGLKEVSRIQSEIMVLFDSLGIPASTEFRDMLAAYGSMTDDHTNRRFYYSASEKGRNQTLRDYQAIIDSMSTELPRMFSLIPKARVKVERVPEFKERTAGTYYQQPQLDGSSPGIFYANLSSQHFKPGMKSLAYHEAIPGHHFQIAIEQESPNSRLFKNLFFFTGYVEGWALYAERLAREYGFYSDIHTLIGYLKSELFRAARLVVDTGVHHKKWTREKAFEYMLENVGWASWPEIDRYILWPGQACAYKIGELKIIELREKTRQELAENFNIKDFHSVVLKNGSVPLEILEQLVNDYIKEKKTR